MSIVDSNVPGLSLSHRLFNKTVLIVGGGEVTFTRLEKLVPTKCKIYIISPTLDDKIIKHFGDLIIEIDETTVEYKEGSIPLEKTVIYHRKKFCDLEDLDPPFKVKLEHEVTPDTFKALTDEERVALTERIIYNNWSLILICIDNEKVSLDLYQYCVLKFPNVPINICDRPKLCPIYFGAVAKIGVNSLGSPDESCMECMISSNGKAPRLASLLKKDIQKRYANVDIQASCNNIEQLRESLKDKESVVSKFKDGNIIPTRMGFLIHVTDAFELFGCQNLDPIKLKQLFIDVYIDKNKELPCKDTLIKEYSKSDIVDQYKSLNIS